ncbi:MAG: pyridoxal-phosphate dependent enzyme, partial [Myxococcota bacterium]
FALDTDFDGCMKLVRQVSEQDGVYLANSMNSLRIEGQKTVALEIAQQLDWQMPDWLVIPGGNLGNVSALAKGLDMLFDLGLISKRPRICVGQAEAANPLYLAYQRDFEVFESISARPTVASAIQIGNPISYQKAVDALRRYDGVVEQATESEIMDECAKADRTGLFNCPHTGVALVALRKLQARGLVRSSDQVVVISTAHGLKFVDSKLAYHSMKLEGIVSEHPNPPIELAADYQSVRDEMLRAIDQRFTG